MSEETRMILGKLDAISDGMQIMQKDITGLKEDVSNLKFCTIQLNERVGNVENEVHVLRLVMENETNKKMELDILGLKADMRMVKEKVGIA